MRKPPHKVCGLRPKVAPLGSVELDRRDPLWDETPSIVDAERTLAIAVIAQAFSDLRLPVLLPEDTLRKKDI